MKFIVSVLLLTAAASGTALASGASPIGKVIQLLSDLQGKIIAEGEEAQKAYSEFSEFCEDRAKQLQFQLKTGETEMSELDASITQEAALISSLTTKTEDLVASIATEQADLQAAVGIRAKEAADFKSEETELVEVVDTLTRAVAILEREMAKGGASALQLKNAGNFAEALSALVQASALSTADGAKLTSLLQNSQQSEDETDALGAPAAAVYEGHSSSIIETLENLLDKAEAQLADARKKETIALHNFQMLKQSLEDSIKFDTKSLSEAKKSIAASGESKAKSEGALKVTTKDHTVDTTALADLHHDCLTKAQDYEAAVKSRGEEVKAVTAARKVLSEETDAADKFAYTLNQVSFVQLSRSTLSSGADLANFEAVHLIRDLARKHHSTALSQLAFRAAAAMSSNRGGQDPFAKVKGLISDMVERLEEEAGSDASHKAYCDKELAEARQKKEDKSSEIEKISTKLEQMATRSAQLKAEVADLQKALADLASAQAEMDKIRSMEKTDYTKNKADLEQGLSGVKLALKILREYYASASGGHAEAKGAGSSIVGLLEVVESDLSKSIAGITAAEESSSASYTDESKENEIEKSSKDQDVKYKSKEAAELDSAVAQAASDRSGVQAELDAVMEYLAGLDKQCIAKPETYEERTRRRTEEIAGLKQALSILEGEAVLLQRHESRALRGVQRHIE